MEVNACLSINEILLENSSAVKPLGYMGNIYIFHLLFECKPGVQI